MKDKQAVVDSNFLVAITDRHDKWHGKAGILLDMLKAEGIRFIYLDSIINETVSVMARRSEEQKRSDQFSVLLNHLLRQIPIESITWVSLEIKQMFSDVIKLVRESSGILNFNDALTALFCRKMNTNAIISFDKDFDQISWLRRIAQPEDMKMLSAQE